MILLPTSPLFVYALSMRAVWNINSRWWQGKIFLMSYDICQSPSRGIFWHQACTKTQICTHTVCAVRDPDLRAIWHHIPKPKERPLPPTLTRTPLKEAVLSTALWHINQMDHGGMEMLGVAGNDSKAVTAKRGISMSNLLVLSVFFYTNIANGIPRPVVQFIIWRSRPYFCFPTEVNKIQERQNNVPSDDYMERVIQEKRAIAGSGWLKKQTKRPEIPDYRPFVPMCRRHCPWEREDGFRWREWPCFWHVLWWGPESCQGPYEEQPPSPHL